MKYALPASIALHVAIGASGLFAWSVAPSGPAEMYIEVPLDIVELANETNIEEVVRPRERPPEPEADDQVDQRGEEATPAAEPEPETEEVAAPPDPEPDAAEEPEPEPPKPEPTPTPTPTPESTPPPTRKTTTPKKSSDPFDDLLSANEKLLDSVDDTKQRKEREVTDQALEDQEQQQRSGAGDRSANQATVFDFVKSYIIQKGCWRSTQDLPDWENLDVTIQFRLDAKGYLLGQPRVIKSARPQNSDPFIRAAVERAIRAVSNCQPFPLADSDYDLWRNEDFNLTFDEKF